MKVFWQESRVLHLLSWSALLGVSIVGCGPPMEVYSHWGPGMRFSETARTYTWAPAALRTTGEGRLENVRTDDLIRETVERHLVRKGYEKVSGGTPDFWIDYRATRNVRGDPYGDALYSEFTEGSLVLCVVNPADGKLIWRGCVQARLQETDSPAVRSQKLDLAVGKMLDQVPSRKRGK